MAEFSAMLFTKTGGKPPADAETIPQKKRAEAKMRKQPAYKCQALDEPTMLEIHRILRERDIEFLPLTPYKAHRLEQKHKQTPMTQVAVQSLKNTVIALRQAKRPGLTETIWEAAYINQDGMLQVTDITVNDSKLTAKNLKSILKEQGLILTQYTHKEFKLLDPATYLRFPKRAYVSRQNLLIRMPDVIAGTQIDPITLKSVIKRLYTIEVNSSQTCMYDKKTGRLQYVCNNIAKYGLTVLDYIQTAYAHALLSEFYRTNPTAGPKNEKSIYEAFRHIFTNEYDNWENDRLITDKQSNIDTPNPDAYDILTKINRPTFEREPENKNKRTFDRVRIFIGLKSKTAVPNRKALIRKYQKDIVKIALIKIEQSKSFMAYGIPIQYIKPTQITITACDELEILFELR